MRLSLILRLAIAALVACATSSQVLTGAPRVPISPAAVRVYTQAPKALRRLRFWRFKKERFR